MKNILYILLFLPILLYSQGKIEGMIMEANPDNEHIGLAGANVYWLNTSVGTVTDLDGKFTLSYKEEYKNNFVRLLTSTMLNLRIAFVEPAPHFIVVSRNTRACPLPWWATLCIHL